MLRDVETREHLQPADHGPEHLERRFRRVVQHPVDAETDDHLVGRRFDVQVRRLVPGGLLEQRVDEPHHRTVGDGVEQERRLDRGCDVARRVTEGALHRGMLVRAVERLEQVLGLGECGNHREPGEHAQVVDREHVARARHRDHELLAPPRDGQRVVAARDVLGDQRGQDQVGRGAAQVDEGHTQVVGEHRGEVVARDHAPLDQGLPQPASRRTLLGKAFRELLFGDQVPLDHELPEARATQVRGRRRGLRRLAAPLERDRVDVGPRALGERNPPIAPLVGRLPAFHHLAPPDGPMGIDPHRSAA